MAYLQKYNIFAFGNSLFNVGNNQVGNLVKFTKIKLRFVAYVFFITKLLFDTNKLYENITYLIYKFEV